MSEKKEIVSGTFLLKGQWDCILSPRIDSTLTNCLL